MSTPGTRRRLVVHLGCSKTGTSSLQAGLWRSIDALAAAGVGMPFRDREEHLDRLVRPLGWVAVESFSQPRDEAALAALPELFRQTPGDVLFVSDEDLAELDRPAAEILARIADEAGLELHLMLTVRGWAVQLPSDYQQFLKHRMTLTFEEFLVAVRDRSAEAGRWSHDFWTRQDPVGILARFDGLVPADRIHVVPIPDAKADPDAIFRATGEIVGFDHTLITRPGKAVNTSFGSVEAEVLRRVTVALPEGSLPTYKDFARAVRRPFATGVLPRGASAKLRLPPEHLAWVEEYSMSTIAALGAAGYRLHGDLATLRPTPEQTAPLPEVDDAEIARVAIETLARYAVFHRERTRPDPAAAVPSSRAPWRRRLTGR